MSSNNIANKDLRSNEKNQDFLDTIHRCPHDEENPYAQISNALIRDNSISPNCRWMLIYFLSMKDKWKINMKQLVNYLKPHIGRDLVYDLINEAIEAGYMKREILTNGNLKSRSIYFMSESPKFKKCFRHPEMQYPENQDAKERTCVKKEHKKNKQKNPEPQETEEMPEVEIPPEPVKPPEKEESRIEPNGSVGGVSKIAFNRKTNKFNGLTDEKKEILRQTFPSVNIDVELNLMAIWLMDNPGYKGTYAFISKWLKKNQPDKPVNNPAPTFEPDPELEELMRQRKEQEKEVYERFNH